MTVWGFWKTEHQRSSGILSEYIDGRLPEEARRLVERHLSRCGQCQGELVSLRATVSMLRWIPQAAPPRSFTITPEMVGGPSRYKQPGYLPAFRYATAMSLLLLVALTVGDMFLGGDYIRPQAAMTKMASESAGPKTQLSEAEAPAAAQRGADSARERGGITQPAQAPEVGLQSPSSAEVPTSPPSTTQGGSAGASFITALKRALTALTVVLASAAAFLSWRSRPRR